MLFHQLKQEFKIKIQQIKANNGLIKLEVEYYQNITSHLLLSWLKAQAIFPKFYWQNRDDSITLTSIGAIKIFDNIEAAQQFSQQHNENLIGGIQFCGKTTFILPRLLFVKNKEKTTVYLIVNSDNLATEVTLIEQLFEKFEQFLPLEEKQNSILEIKSCTSFKQWSKNIQVAISHIKQNKFNKVVLANATDFICQQKISAYDLLGLSQKKNQHCFHFLYQENTDTAFIGSSPERLYKRENQYFYTEALAGTVAVTNDPIQTAKNGNWLLNDSKNILENQYVVGDICTNLKSYTQSIKIGDRHLKYLPKVQHLRRIIEMELKDNVNDTDCLKQIHPTAAVAGSPRTQALDFIYQTETFPRQWYAGTLGFFNPEQAEFCVTLRSAQITDNIITIYAGAGIMEDSTPDSEWQEIGRKALAMTELLK